MIFAFLIRSNTPPQAVNVSRSSLNLVPYIFVMSYCLSKSNCVIKKYSKPGNILGLSAWPVCNPLSVSSFSHTFMCSLINFLISGGFADGPIPLRPK